MAAGSSITYSSLFLATCKATSTGFSTKYHCKGETLKIKHHCHERFLVEEGRMHWTKLDMVAVRGNRTAVQLTADQITTRLRLRGEAGAVRLKGGAKRRRRFATSGVSRRWTSRIHPTPFDRQASTGPALFSQNKSLGS